MKIYKNKKVLTAEQKHSLYALCHAYGALLNKRSELRKSGEIDHEITQRYYENYCKLLGAAEVLNLVFEIDYNARQILFYSIDDDNVLLRVPISNLVFERFSDFQKSEINEVTAPADIPAAQTKKNIVR